MQVPKQVVAARVSTGVLRELRRMQAQAFAVSASPQHQTLSRYLESVLTQHVRQDQERSEAVRNRSTR